MALPQDAEPQLVANLPAGTDEASVLIPTLSHTLYALSATLTTGRSLRLAHQVPNRNGFEVWRQLVAKNAPVGRRFAVWQAVLQPGMGDNPAKFEESLKTWQHQVDVYEKLATSRLDDVKISVVLREAATKLRGNVLVNSQQLESDYNKLRAITQASLKSNKSWTSSDLRNDTKESDLVEIYHTGKGKNKGKGKDKGKSKGKSKGKGATADQQDKECYVCGKKGH